MLSTFTFFTSEFHPFDHPWAWARFRPLEVTNLGLSLPAFGDGGVSTQDLAQAIGTASILFQSGLLIALLLLLIRRWGGTAPIGLVNVRLHPQWGGDAPAARRSLGSAIHHRSRHRCGLALPLAPTRDAAARSGASLCSPDKTEPTASYRVSTPVVRRVSRWL